MRAEPGISGEGNGHEPELRALIIAIDMNVRRLVGFMAKEIECIRTNPQNCRHDRIVAISNARNKLFLTDVFLSDRLRQMRARA